MYVIYYISDDSVYSFFNTSQIYLQYYEFEINVSFRKN